MTAVRAWRVGDAGGLELRGWRAHCPDCGYLGEPKGYRAAVSELDYHRLGRRQQSTPPKCPAR